MNPLLSLAEWLFYILCAALPTWLAARYFIDKMDQWDEQRKERECERHKREQLEESRRYVLAMRRGR